MMIEDVSPREKTVVSECLKMLVKIKSGELKDEDVIKDLNTVMEKLCKAKKFRLTSLLRAMERGGHVSSENVPPEVNVHFLRKNHEALKAFWKEREDHIFMQFFTKKKLYGLSKGEVDFKEADCAANMASFWELYPDKLDPPNEDWVEPEGAFDLVNYPAYVLDKHTSRKEGDKTQVGFVTNGAKVNNTDLFFATEFYFRAQEEYEKQAKEMDEKKMERKRKSEEIKSASKEKKGKDGGKHQNMNYVNIPLPECLYEGEKIVLCRHVCLKKATFYYKGCVYSKASQCANEMDVLKNDYGLTALNTKTVTLPFVLKKVGQCNECEEQKFSSKTCSRWTFDNTKVIGKQEKYCEMDCIVSGMEGRDNGRDFLGLSLADALRDESVCRENVLKDYLSISVYRYLFNSTDCNPNNMLVVKKEDGFRLVSVDENGIGMHKNFWFTMNDVKMLSLDKDLTVLKEVVDYVKDVTERLKKEGVFETLVADGRWRKETLSVFNNQFEKIDFLLEKESYKEREVLYKKLFK
jgi:hypothetical protein